jgi:DNA-binding CsgD family transcriptional regulator
MPSEKEIARMVMLSGLGFDGTEIADKLGYSSGTVYKYLGSVEDRARASDNERQVFYDIIMADVFDDRFRQMLASSL